MHFLLVVMALLLLSGCAKHIECQVNSFSNYANPKGNKYFILSANKDVPTSDLEFAEYARHIGTVLNKNGLQRVDSLDEASIVVFLGYGISDPKHTRYSYTIPEYGKTSGGSSSFSSTTFGQGGMYNTFGTINTQPEYGVTGYKQVSGVKTRFTGHILLDAYDLDTYKRTKELKPMWKIVVTSSGPKGDLRYIVPYMATSFDGFVGINSMGNVPVKVKTNDDRVIQLQSSQ